MKNKTYAVKRLRLLQFLIGKGFKEYTIIPDPTSTKGYNWFVFEYTPELQEALDEYFKTFEEVIKSVK